MITDGGVDHIVMELIEARTLADVVADSGPLDERSALAVAQQLLDALGAAHDSGVVHRDVKPSNVMLGARGRVTLTDFGIAQAADDPRLTTTGSLVGSPGYLAPERLEGQPATPASDLWSLGATLYYAVQGTSPFTRESTAATIWAVLHGGRGDHPHPRPAGSRSSAACCSATRGPGSAARRPRPCWPARRSPAAADVGRGHPAGAAAVRRRRPAAAGAGCGRRVALLVGLVGGGLAARYSRRAASRPPSR